MARRPKPFRRFKPFGRSDSVQFAESPSRAQIQSLSREFATRDAAEWSTFLGILPDPDPVLRKRGDDAAVLENLLADPHLVSVVGTRKAGTKAREWRIEPGTLEGEKPTPEAEELAKRFTADLERVDVENLVVQILDAPLFGVVPIELLWRPENGRVRLHDLRALPYRWFGFDKDNQPRFLSVDNPWDGLELPFGKFVFARHEPTYDNPYGKRLLTRCFWPVTFKNGGLQFWLNFIEKYGSPFLVGKYAPGTKPEDQSRMLAQLAAMVQDAVAVIPAGSTVELLSGQGSGGSNVFERLSAVMDAYISKVIMGQTLTAEVGSTGSYAASKTHENVLAQYQASDQALVRTVMQEIAWIYGQVNAPGVPTPLWVWYEEEDIQKDRADRDNTLSQALERSGLRLTRTYYLGKYGLAEDDLEPLPDKPESAGPGVGSQFAEACQSPTAQYQEKIDGLAESSAKKAAEFFKGNEERLLKIVTNSNGYEDAFEKLLEEFPKLEGSVLEDLLSRALTAAEFYGRWTVGQEVKTDER
jgi:phage gp29-like protein